MRYQVSAIVSRISTAIIAAITASGLAWANYCPAGPLGQKDLDYNVYLEVKSSEQRVLEVRKILHASGSNCKAVRDDRTMFKTWYKCDSVSPSGWPVELNHCPSGYVQGSTPRGGGGGGGGGKKEPAKATCKRGDIEGKWQRTRDGTQLVIGKVWRKDGGYGRMHKYRGNFWPMTVGKFYSIRQIGNTCEWKARCTTVHRNVGSKSYNWSAVPCTLRLSSDKKKITTSDGSGTWMRGWK